MITDAFNKSEIARLYFEKQGKHFTKQEAANRFRMVHPDVDILKKIIREVCQKQLINFNKKENV
jgi:hypothetical protein